MDEVWKAAPGYDGFYEVSNLGRVRSLTRVVQSSRTWRPFRAGKVIRGTIMSPGRVGKYLQVWLCRNRAKRGFLVHQLVLLTFVGTCPDGLETRHLDGNGHNNALENLAYGTKKENAADRVTHGTERVGSKHWNARLCENQVLQILSQLSEGAHIPTLARSFGVSRDVIYRIRKGTLWRHVKR